MATTLLPRKLQSNSTAKKPVTAMGIANQFGRTSGSNQGDVANTSQSPRPPSRMAMKNRITQ